MRWIIPYHWNKLRTAFESLKKKLSGCEINAFEDSITSEIDVKVENVAVSKVAVIHILDLKCSP